MTEKSKAAWLEYVGPPGQESPVVGVLVPGERYQFEDAALAAYLAQQHPSHWREPKPAKPARPAEE